MSEAKRMTPGEFRALDKDTVTLVDVREPDEVLIEEIENAK